MKRKLIIYAVELTNPSLENVCIPSIESVGFSEIKCREVCGNSNELIARVREDIKELFEMQTMYSPYLGTGSWFMKRKKENEDNSNGQPDTKATSKSS